MLRDSFVQRACGQIAEGMPAVFEKIKGIHGEGVFGSCEENYMQDTIILLHDFMKSASENHNQLPQLQEQYVQRFDEQTNIYYHS